MNRSLAALAYRVEFAIRISLHSSGFSYGCRIPNKFAFYFIIAHIRQETGRILDEFVVSSVPSTSRSQTGREGPLGHNGQLPGLSQRSPARVYLAGLSAACSPRIGLGGDCASIAVAA